MEDRKYTKDNLNVLGIFQLRDLARGVGVHLPTTYKKDELIEKILQVVNGEIKPFVPKNKKGRPPKSLMDFKSDVFEPQTQVVKKAKFSWLLGEFIAAESGLNLVDELKVCMPDSVFYSKEENKPQQLLGVVFVEPNGAGALHIGGLSNITNDDIAYVSTEIIKGYGIKTGDEIKCSVYVNTENEKVVSEVFEVNGKNALSTKNRKETKQNGEVVNSCEKIDFGFCDSIIALNKDVPIGKGQRVFVHADRATTCTKFLGLVSLSSPKNNMKTIVISIDKRPEEKFIYSGDIEYLFCNFDMTPFKQMYLVNIGIERAKRLCEMGVDVMLVVDNMLSTLRAYDCFFERDESNAYSMQAQIAVKKIFAIGGNVLNAGSITLFAGVCDGDQEANNFFSRVETFCNSHIYLETNKDGEFLILQKSYTENAKELLK